jgi:hypothetical protein
MRRTKTARVTICEDYFFHNHKKTDVKNHRQISQDQMAQELTRKGISLIHDQIRDFLSTESASKDP